MHARAGRRGGQFALARRDPVYLGLRSGRAGAGILFRSDFEKQIQTSEMTHDATNRRIAVRIRTPTSAEPDCFQSDYSPNSQR